MSDKERERICVRFRKKLDYDLRQATKGLNDGEVSDLARDGLRLMLGIRTTRAVEVRERPLSIP